MSDILVSWAAPGTRIGQPKADERPDRYPAYGAFRCPDGGWVTLGVLTEDRFWDALCHSLGLGELAAIDAAGRASEAAALRERISNAIGSWERDSLVAALIEAEVPAAPVLDRQEAVVLDHFAEREVTVIGSDGITATGHPVRFHNHPALPAVTGDPVPIDLSDPW